MREREGGRGETGRKRQRDGKNEGRRGEYEKRVRGEETPQLCSLINENESVVCSKTVHSHCIVLGVAIAVVVCGNV